MAEMTPERKKKRVVVVGGGVAGSLLCKTLLNNKHLDFTLIDSCYNKDAICAKGSSAQKLKHTFLDGTFVGASGSCIVIYERWENGSIVKEYFEVSWANLRSMVEPSFAKRTVINHHEYLPGASIITCDAIGIEEDHVSTMEGRLIEFDYLVIATGHIGSGYVTKVEKLRQYEAENEKIKSSESILIVGGGPSGVELAAEIAVDFPTKKVKLVHRGSRLLEFIGEVAGKKALDWLTARKVEVILGQSIDFSSSSDGVYQTSSGEEIMADCLFKCTSNPIGSSWLQQTVLKDSMDDFGRLKVDETLRVKDVENVFAIGDVTDIPELKQGYLAQRHALVVAQNLKLLSNGCDESALVKYTPASPMAIVSLGRREALIQIWCLTVVGRIPGMLKSKDLFVGKTRKQLGLKA